MNSEIKVSRRSFLSMVGLVCVTFPAIQANANLSNQYQERSGPQHPPKIDGNSLNIGSGAGIIPHYHDLLIPLDILKNPPSQGVKLSTTKTALHVHSVILTQFQLRTIADGGSVEVKDATVGEHTFVIFLPKVFNRGQNLGSSRF